MGRGGRTIRKASARACHVRANGETTKGLEALRRKGALPWPDPETPGAFADALAVKVSLEPDVSGQKEFSLSVEDELQQTHESSENMLSGNEPIGSQLSDSSLTPADELFSKVRELLQKITIFKTDAEVAAELQVSKSQAKEWLQRLVDEGVLEKLSKPIRYRVVSSQASLFERQD